MVDSAVSVDYFGSQLDTKIVKGVTAGLKTDTFLTGLGGVG